jgi:hypothetical protein
MAGSGGAGRARCDDRRVRPPRRRQAFVLGGVLLVVAVVPLAWALTCGSAGAALPFDGPALVAVRLGLLGLGALGLGALGLGLGVVLLRGGLEAAP